MRTFRSALALFAIISVAATVPVSAQGISEMGGVNAGTAGMIGGLHGRAGQAGSTLDNLYNAPARALGGTDTGSSQPIRTAQVKIGPDGEPLPPNPHDIVRDAGKVANKYYAIAQEKEKAGKLSEAEKYYSQALSVRHKIWGDSDPAVVRMYMILGGIEVKLKHYDSAEGLYKRAFQSALKSYGMGNYELVPYLNNLGDAYNADQKFSDAANYYQQIRQLKSRKLGDDNKETISSGLKLARAYVASKDKMYWSDTEKLLKSTIASAEKSPDTAPQLIGLLDTYNALLTAEGKPDDAAKVASRADELRAQQPAAAAKPAVTATAGKDEEKSSNTGAASTAVRQTDTAATPAVTPAATPAVTESAKTTSATSTSNTSEAKSSSSSTKVVEPSKPAPVKTVARTKSQITETTVKETTDSQPPVVAPPPKAREKSALPPAKSKDTDVAVKSDKDDNQTLSKEETNSPVLPPKAEKKETVLPVKTEKKETVLPPKAEKKDTVLPVKAEKKETVLPPKAEKKDTVLPVRAEVNRPVLASKAEAEVEGAAASAPATQQQAANVTVTETKPVDPAVLAQRQEKKAILRRLFESFGPHWQDFFTDSLVLTDRTDTMKAIESNAKLTDAEKELQKAAYDKYAQKKVARFNELMSQHNLSPSEIALDLCVDGIDDAVGWSVGDYRELEGLTHLINRSKLKLPSFTGKDKDAQWRAWGEKLGTDLKPSIDKMTVTLSPVMTQMKLDEDNGKLVRLTLNVPANTAPNAVASSTAKAKPSTATAKAPANHTVAPSRSRKTK